MLQRIISSCLLTLLHSERPKLHTILVYLSAIGLTEYSYITIFLCLLRKGDPCDFPFAFLDNETNRGLLSRERTCSSRFCIYRSKCSKNIFIFFCLFKNFYFLNLLLPRKLPDYTENCCFSFINFLSTNKVLESCSKNSNVTCP